MRSRLIATTGRRALHGSVLAVLLSACALTHSTAPTQLFDFGTATPVPDAHPGGVLGVAPLGSASWLQSVAIRYRLPYTEPNQIHSYATSRWTMPPAELLEERLRDRLGADFSVTDAEAGAHSALLRVDLDEFTQIFRSETDSVGLVQFRASLSRHGTLLGQRTFTVERPAASADAPGGVNALKDATDAALADLDQWVRATLR